MADLAEHMAGRNYLIIMVKEPRVGAVKSRLARDVGAVEATRFYRTTTERIVRRLAWDARWETVLAIAPDKAVASRAWPGRVARVTQGGGDIGERMARLLGMPPFARAVLIGSDIPGVTASHIAKAFQLLGRHDIVFGPAEDGGFWLVGVRNRRALIGLFTCVRWSTKNTLADTLQNLAGRKAGYAARLADVDDAAALRSICRKI